MRQGMVRLERRQKALSTAPIETGSQAPPSTVAVGMHGGLGPLSGVLVLVETVGSSGGHPQGLKALDTLPDIELRLGAECCTLPRLRKAMDA